MALKNITIDNFREEVLDSNKTVLLDFWATWCGPCKMIAPVVEQIAKENPHITVGKVNVDEQPELAQEFGIMSIPTLVVLKNGEVVNQASGYRPKEQILQILGL